MAEAGWRQQFEKILAAKPWLITVALAGTLVLVAALAFLGIGLSGGREEIQIIESTTEATASAAAILVDVGGAVEKPGLYQLAVGARVNDALIAAGGLALEADRDWVSQNLNLAQKLEDGNKVYVPFRGETSKDNPHNLQGLSLQEQININTASLTALETLWGIGPVTAQKIIDHRPYSKIEELLEKKIVKSNVYEAIKDKITAL